MKVVVDVFVVGGVVVVDVVDGGVVVVVDFVCSFFSSFSRAFQNQ